jgi:hypothetical protein
VPFPFASALLHSALQQQQQQPQQPRSRTRVLPLAPVRRDALDLSLPAEVQAAPMAWLPTPSDASSHADASGAATPAFASAAEQARAADGSAGAIPAQTSPSSLLQLPAQASEGIAECTRKLSEITML